MAQEFKLATKQFKGLRNDEDQKNIAFDYFYRVRNFNYPETGVLGFEKILMPKRIVQLPNAAKVDGLVEYRYLDQDNVLQKQYIAVGGGNVYRFQDLQGSAGVLIRSGLQVGMCSFEVFNDKLYIANGKDYVNIYNGVTGLSVEMGAPVAIPNTTSGNLVGNYTYKITMVTAGGEEVLGSISNLVSVTTKQVDLTLPIGYTGVTDRKIYRTTGTNANYWYLLHTMGNNTTTTYTDNATDASIIGNAQIPTTIDTLLPKPYHLKVCNQKLFGAKVDKYPTQIFISDINNDLFDVSNGLDVANYGSDNTPVEGIGTDFNKILVGTNRNIIMINPSDLAVTFTRSNIGILDGYSVQRIPAFAEFPGGMFFVSTEKDVRVMSGLQALPVSTSLDNVRTENWSQQIKGTLKNDLDSYMSITSAFYNYRYHLCVDGNKYVFDTRTQGWSYHQIESETYQSKPTYLAVAADYLFNGQNDGWIEQEYAEVTYRTEEVPAFIESPWMVVSNKYSFIEKLYLWYTGTVSNEITVNVYTDDNDNFPIEAIFTVRGGAFDPEFYDPNFFDTTGGQQDYRIVNINRNARWIKYRMNVDVGNIILQGFEIKTQLEDNT